MPCRSAKSFQDSRTIIADCRQRIVLCASISSLPLAAARACALQKGHQSAERKNRMTVPFGLLSVSLVCSWPN